MGSFLSKIFLNPNQKKEASAATKKRNLDDDESAALVKKLKSVSVIPDNLEEILPQFSLAESECLRKFMASGKELFAAAMRYFSHVKCVEVSFDRLIVYVKRFPLKKDEETNRHAIPYDFEYMDKLLEILVKYNKKLSIGAFFQYGLQSDTGKRIFANLVRKNLDCVYFESSQTPASYLSFFKNECRLREVQIYLCLVTKPTLTDFFEMKASNHCIACHFQSFFERLMKIPTGLTFPAVEKLIIRPYCDCENYFPTFDYMFTEETFRKLSTRLAQHFPNLQFLDVSFRSTPKQMDLNWDTVYGIMLEFTPQIFSALPSHLKGSISIYYGDRFSQIEEAMELYGDDKNSGVEIEDNKLIKKFDIHDGLTFKFELGLLGQMFDEFFLQLQPYDFDVEEEEPEYDDAGAD